LRRKEKALAVCRTEAPASCKSPYSLIYSGVNSKTLCVQQILMQGKSI
jgi:hypothetical protein